MVVDVGTGDGGYVLRTAKLRPEALFIGVDANADALREASARALKKPSRGGLRNVLFGRLALEEMPGALEGIADELTVLFPWGTLLRAVATGQVEPLRHVCRAGARVRFVFGYGPADGLALPPIESRRPVYPGFEVTVRPLGDPASLPTTWAKKLAFSGKSRPFVEVVGIATLVR